MAGTPTDFNECVSKGELATFMTEQRNLMTELTRNVNNLVTRIEQLEQRPPPYRADDEDADAFGDEDAYADGGARRRLNFNRRGMGGNNHGNNDPFAKIKFSLPPFAGNVDPEAYLDWELAVQQKFDSHNVPPEHRVRLATSEFTNFALFWWSDLCNANNAAAVPQTWNVLKQRMKSRFVPPYYQRDLRLKLQTLKQGDKGVEAYYQELLIGLARCGINEDDNDASARFFGGLNHDIQNILDYKEWRNFSQLYHLAIKAEREVQGRKQHQPFRSNNGRNFQQRSEPETTKLPVAPQPSTPPFSSGVSKLSNVQFPQLKKGGTPGASTSSSSSSSKIICHRCKGMGHVMKDCPSRRAFIATEDGYVSASDVEDDLALAANIDADPTEGDQDKEAITIDSVAAAADYPSLLVQRVLSTRVGHEEEMKIQRHNLFHMYLIVQGCRVLTIIDGGSCNNLVSSDLVDKLGLTTRQHSYPYKLQWFNNSGKTKVTKSARISFFTGSYHDTADFDVVPMQACSILLGRPWEFDNDALHHGRTNTYTIIHKDKKITLLPLSPTDIVKHANEIKNKPPTDIAKNNGIKLKGGAFLATTSATAELCDNPDAPCYTMFCQPFMSGALPAVTNLLQEFADDGMESRTTPILEGGDDEDIAKMESRTTPIREGEDDEDIAMLDTSTPGSSPSCNLFPTQLPRRPRIQQTRRHCFGHNFIIQHRNGPFLDALERGRRRRRFGSGPSSRRSVDHSV